MFYLYEIINAIIISIIEGITEFLPISSTGHMIIASYWLGIANNHTKILEKFIQLGSALAILYFFHKKIISIMRFNIHIKKKINIIHLIFSILPTILIGLIFYQKINALLNTESVMYASILGGFFLILSEISKPKKHKISDLNEINLFQSIIIGLFQIFSLCPGISRSGMTIGTGILLGMKRSVAIDFSFIISIPLLIGASFYDLINNLNYIQFSELPIFFTGFIMSFIVSRICIRKLLNIIKKTSLIFFGIYRFIIAACIYFIN